VSGSFSSCSWLCRLAILAVIVGSFSGCAHPRREVSPVDIRDSTFQLVSAYIVSFNVPAEDTAKVLRSITDRYPLQYGDYEHVAFRSAAGVEQFRPLKGSRAGEQVELSEVPTTRVTFAIPQSTDVLRKVVAAIREAHPYEEPVIQIHAGWISRAKHEGEESNPNRWWNRPPAAEPSASRSSQ
jgi:hypothetical protein